MTSPSGAGHGKEEPRRWMIVADEGNEGTPMKFASKKDLIESMKREHQTFLDLAGSVSRARYKEEGVWGDDWTVHDLFAHLTEWEQMFVTWFQDGLAGNVPALPAPGFKWSETRQLNQAIWKKHRGKSTQLVLAEFEASFEEIFALTQRLTEKELFTPGHFAWTKKNALTTYLGANSASHYRTASKILKRWLRAQK